MRISIVLSTHNRAEPLRRTLAAMSEVDRLGLDVTWFVIDNNSTDETRAVIESFQDTMPVEYLFEPGPGKNRALNHCIDTASLGEIVVLTDDDVSPESDWLHAVASSCERWQDHAVFGGRISVQWPVDEPPAWATEPGILDFGFSHHHPTDSETVYPPHIRPYGPNMWVRRSIFDAGFRFDERIGPRPNNRIMGSETSFLLTLAEAGFDAVYCPDAVVHHRIAVGALEVESILRRAYRSGRGRAHTHERDASRWQIPSRLIMAVVRYATTLGRTHRPHIVARRVYAISQLGWCIERARMTS